MAQSGDYILVCVPNKQLIDDPSAKTKTYEEITGLLADAATVNKFHLPELRTGTLERLMQAADNLSKVDASIEQVIRKIERQLSELEDSASEVLYTVEDQPVLKYVEHFNWSSAKYPTGRQVDELTNVIVQQGVKLEEELKEGSAYLQDKRSSLASAQRRKEGNLTVVDLEDILTAEVVVPLASTCGRSFGETEYLKDVVVVVPRGSESSFMQKYETLAEDMVGYGENGDRESVRGSPVVPGSAVKAFEDAEGYQLYIVNILKNFYDEFKRACLGNRFTVREYDFSRITTKEGPVEGDDGEVKASLSAMKNEFAQAEQQLKRWCKAHYGEVFISWMHIKAIRLFVESCLRYGIPPNFSAALIKPKRKAAEKKVRSKLLEAYGSLDSSGMMRASKDEIGTEDQVFPYVSLDISVFGSAD